MYSGNQDKILPRADTCFFNLELPNYSTYEVLKERIILAITIDCDSMNAEDPNQRANLTMEIQTEESYE
jgi:other hect domain ubiquitin protein ligase E3